MERIGAAFAREIAQAPARASLTLQIYKKKANFVKYNLMVRSESMDARSELATVLVVDDDAALLKALSRVIRSAGFEVWTFDRPTALLASAIPRTNACLVVDIELPEMSGIELCLTLTRSGCGLPAILITGQNSSGSEQLFEGSEAVAVLYKPIDERPFLEAIGRAIGLSNAG